MIWTAWYTWYLIAVFLVIDRLTKHAENQYQTALENVVDQLKEIIIEEEMKLSNKLNLTTLLTYKPTQKDYDKVLDMLVELARKRYEEDKFLIAKAPEGVADINLIYIVSNWSEDPELHKNIFSSAVHTNLDMRTVQQQFSERAKAGEVLELGDGVVVIIDDNTGNPPTGVSPINSGLEGSEIAFNITFILKDKYEEWEKNTFPEPAEETNE